MRKNFFATSNHRNWFLWQNGILWHIFRFSVPLTGRPSLSQQDQASHRKAPCLGEPSSNAELSISQGGWAPQREAGPLTRRPDFSQEGQDPHKEARSLSGNRAFTGSLGLSQGGRASHREAWSLKGRPGLSQRGRTSHREAGSLTGKLGLSQGGKAFNRVICNLLKIQIKSKCVLNI